VHILVACWSARVFSEVRERLAPEAEVPVAALALAPGVLTCRAAAALSACEEPGSMMTAKTEWKQDVGIPSGGRRESVVQHRTAFASRKSVDVPMKTITAAGNTTTYTYNVMGERIRKSGSRLFVYDEAGHLIWLCIRELHLLYCCMHPGCLLLPVRGRMPNEASLMVCISRFADRLEYFLWALGGRKRKASDLRGVDFAFGDFDPCVIGI
jgi:hypothetical protein